ncbi:hypothetical protein CA850_29635 [Micromonospora echinospora]|uniref:Nucleoside 2-deoxyribosyltransferase n=1 Tax=Micromonospora echinospora TaxID=1877 RepID=A0A1C5ABK5_MICEC|nr:DUF4406 domain-containing protein [Micromonospora echinospora]OZV74742.1 hypothetical protein CA850_29635 [Micromonospora echinospora]SCE66524.1 protein of unknown function [Micromonospora echinospora]SCF42539.1 protein of unknown function [Micromonospora echinospora]
MSDGKRASREGVPLAGLAGLAGRRVYLLGSAAGTPAERSRRFSAVACALAGAGFDVVMPGWTHPETQNADDLLSVVDDDVSALASADVVVALPGSESLWEYTMAGLLGVPVVPSVECTLLRSA